MYKRAEGVTRTKKFKVNDTLEDFLNEINNDLWHSEKILLNKAEPDYPIIFMMGTQRSGSTLFLQWLANLEDIAYPTNFMSRLYKTPIIASKLQLLLTDERYNYRNEIKDFNSSINFKSENGKTKGALSPNEFWYFWKRFLPYKDLDYLSTEELFEKVDVETLKAEFTGITDVYKKPFAIKSMILNYNIDFLNKIFEKAIFIYNKREVLANIESTLNARQEQFGTINEWYSFKIPEYSKLKNLNPYEQVAGQIYHINRAVETGLENVEDHKKMVVNYEEFCENPERFYIELKAKLKLQGYLIESEYKGPESFNTTRKEVTNENIIKGFHEFNKNNMES